jgi:hypothetical protein
MSVKNKICILIILLISSLFLVGCGSAQIEDHANQQPTLHLEKFFEGKLSAHGVVKDFRGSVVRHFNADIHASWKDGVGMLVEDFVFDDGELQRRIWTLTPDGSGGYIGTAGDVVGQGVIRIAGNAMFLKYVLRIPFRSDTLDITVDDRMYLVNPSTLINESRLIKFGFEVGEILLVISKKSSS